MSDAWNMNRTYTLPGLQVRASDPVLVARRKGYLWFPSLTRFANGDLLATMSNYADVTTNTSTAHTAWSTDGGRTWTAPVETMYGDVSVPLPSGDTVLLPYYLFPAPGGMRSSCRFVARGARQTTRMADRIVVTGWPRPDKANAEIGVSGFVFNGQSVRLRDGRFLATLYGTFDGDSRYSLVVAESGDGFEWAIRSVVAGPDCPVNGNEGPCEAAIVRLRDGRLLCLFRTGSNYAYGQTYSSDDGRTWTRPFPMANAFSVQPSLATMPDGMVVLSGGRPGIYLWFNLDGAGNAWQRLNMEEHHNATRPDEYFALPGTSSSYTEVVAMDDRRLLLIYDRIPYGWAPIPADSAETNSVWVVQVEVVRR